MKPLIPTLVVAALIAGHVGAATNATPLVQIDSRDFGDTNCLMKLVEFERHANTSKLRLTYQKLGSSVGGSMFIMRGFYEIAKARGTEYFINLKEWDDEQGGRIFVAGFTNTKDADLKREFGKEYSYEHESGQKRMFQSVSQFKPVFEKPEGRIEDRRDGPPLYTPPPRS